MKRTAVPIIAGVVLAACGGGPEGADVSDVWARTSAPGQTLGAVYFDLTVDEDDTFVGATVSSDVAARAEIHEVVMADVNEMDDMEMSEGSDDMDDMQMDDMEMSGDVGAMRMQEMPNGLALPAGEIVSFEPGSYHMMLPELVAPLEAGDEFELTLDFENADDATVTVEVADSAP